MSVSYKQCSNKRCTSSSMKLVRIKTVLCCFNSAFSYCTCLVNTAGRADLFYQQLALCCDQLYPSIITEVLGLKLQHVTIKCTVPEWRGVFSCHDHFTHVSFFNQ